jgi:hypothetical protein
MTETTPEPAAEYVPGDRTGYQVIDQEADNPDVQTTWAVVRESDGVGLGAYAAQEHVDEIIARDRAHIQEIAQTGLDHVPPLVVTDNSTVMVPTSDGEPAAAVQAPEPTA